MSEIPGTGPTQDSEKVEYNYDPDAVERFQSAADKERGVLLRSLKHERPEDRIPVINEALNPDMQTRIKAAGLEALANTGIELPQEALPLIDQAIHDPNDNVSARAVRTLVGPAREIPEQAMPLIDYAMTRKAKVRQEVPYIAMHMAYKAPDLALGLFERSQQDRSARYSATRYMFDVVEKFPQYFDIGLKGEEAQQNIEASNWHNLLERELQESYPSGLYGAVMRLEQKEPGAGLELLKLKMDVEKRLPDKQIAERQKRAELYGREINYGTVVGNFLTSSDFKSTWRYDQQFRQSVFDRIVADPELNQSFEEAFAKLAEASKSKNSPYNFNGYEWRDLSKVIPQVAERLEAMFPEGISRISDNSDLYREDRERLSDYGARPGIFGLDLVNKLHEAQDPDRLLTDKGFLNELNYGRRRLGVEEGIDLDYQFEHFLSSELRMVGVSRSSLELDNNDPEALREYIKWLEFHVGEELRRYEDCQRRIPEWQDRFRERLSRYGVDSELVDRRITETRVTFFDYVEAMSLKGEDYYVGGDFSDRLSLARVRSFEPFYEQERIYSHELLHATSGRALIHQPGNLTNREEIINQRVGLEFKPANNHPYLFRWLNEAITEDLNKEMMGNSELDSSYREERHLLQLLCTFGSTEVPVSVFREAYFENYDPDDPTGERVPKYKELQRQLMAAYGERILVNLDNVIKEAGGRRAGIRAGITYMQRRSWPSS